MTERTLSQTTPAAGGGLDSGSELSELTEEEQDNDNQSNDEENDEDGENEAEEEVEGNRRRPIRGSGRRKRGGMVPAPMWDWAYKQKKSVDRGTTQPEEEEEEEERQRSPPKAMEEEEDEEEEEEDSRQTSVRPGNRENGVAEPADKDPSAAWDAGLTEAERAKHMRGRILESFPQGSAGRRSAANGDDTDEDDDEDDEEEDADVEEEDGDVPQLNLDAADPGVESESDADIDVLPVGPAILSAIAPMDVDIDENVDVTAPSPSAIAPMVALAAQASIMAGSSILASATPSPDSSLSGSPTSSRSASPVPGKDEDEDAEGDEDTTIVLPPKRATKKKLIVEEDPETLPSASTTTDGAKSKALAKNVEAEDIEVASVLHDELDLEIDADLQPAHRAEALDVLATIELKFALLRERVYVEKMEGLAWEETLITEGVFLFTCIVIIYMLLTEGIYRYTPGIRLSSKRIIETRGNTQRIRRQAADLRHRGCNQEEKGERGIYMGVVEGQFYILHLGHY